METSVGGLLLSGSGLMLIGMTIVFLFLLLLVGVIQLTAYLLQRLWPEIHYFPCEAVPVGTGEAEDDAEVVAAITAALRHHRKR